MPEFLKFPSFKDARGSLTVIEKILPFSIERVYYIWDTNELSRGNHSHQVGKQVLICLQSQCVVRVKIRESLQEFVLDSPEQGLILEPEDWHSLHFEPKAILLVLASHPYLADNYVS